MTARNTNRRRSLAASPTLRARPCRTSIKPASRIGTSTGADSARSRRTHSLPRLRRFAHRLSYRLAVVVKIQDKHFGTTRGLESGFFAPAQPDRPALPEPQPQHNGRACWRRVMGRKAWVKGQALRGLTDAAGRPADRRLRARIKHCLFYESARRPEQLAFGWLRPPNRTAGFMSTA